MQIDPRDIIGEVLGVRAVMGVDPSISGYACPHTKSTCTKRSQKGSDNPYPVCSLWQAKSDKNKPEEGLIFVCPKRFFAVDFLNEVIQHCWPGEKPQNPKIAKEVTMTGFGNVDFVIADVGPENEIKQFLSVELQAIDITGSVFSAYEDLRKSQNVSSKITYGFNWDNVYKRYITQLIRKGYFHHHWKSKIVAVIPEQVYKRIKSKADFLSSSNVQDQQVNIIFMTYSLEADPNRIGEYRPRLVRVEGTSHSNLQNAILYKEPPKKEDFSKQIIKSIIKK